MPDAKPTRKEIAQPTPPAGSSRPAPPEVSRKPAPPAGEDPNRPDPTRFGDWEINGRCIDF